MIEGDSEEHGEWGDKEGREKGRDVSKLLYQSLVSLMDHQSSPLNNRVRDALLTFEKHRRTRLGIHLPSPLKSQYVLIGSINLVLF